MQAFQSQEVESEGFDFLSTFPVSVPPAGINYDDEDEGISTETKRKIAHLVSGKLFFTLSSAGILTGTFYFRSIRLLTSACIVNGGAIAHLHHALLPEKFHKEFKKFISSWAYEIVFTASQLKLNLTPSFDHFLYMLPFAWGFGYSEAKDLITILTMDQADLPFSTLPPGDRPLIPTADPFHLGMSLRDKSCLAKLILVGTGVSSVGLAALNFSLVSSFDQAGELGEIGFYQDILAACSGAAAGRFTMILLMNWREGRMASGRVNKYVKIAKVFENVMIVFPPVFTTLLLSLPLQPNSLGSFTASWFVGGIWASNVAATRFEFENPNSHSRHAGQLALEGVEKVKEVAKKVLPSAAFFAALTGFMLAAALGHEESVHNAIITLLTTTFISYGLTYFLAETHAQPPGQNRWRNELDFQILYSSTSLAIFLQYGLTLLAIGDEDLQQSSNVLYALSLLTWGAWGINVGINRALQGFRENLRLLPVAPPLSRQVLMQSVIQNF